MDPVFPAYLQHTQVNSRGVVHDLRIVFAGEDISCTTHIGSQLIYLIDVAEHFFDCRNITQIADNEFVSGARGELRIFQIDSAYLLALFE